MDFDLLGLGHTVLGVSALGFGASVLGSEKGTLRHRRLGRAYGASMVGLLATGLLIYDLFGYFGPFHYFAIIGMVTLVAGLVPVLRRRPAGTWVDYHAHFMCWSFIGLVAATVAEIATRLPSVPFQSGVIWSSVLVILVGYVVVRTRLRPLLRKRRLQRGG